MAIFLNSIVVRSQLNSLLKPWSEQLAQMSITQALC